MDAICLMRKKKRTLYDVIFASCVSYMRQDHSRTPYGIIGVYHWGVFGTDAIYFCYDITNVYITFFTCRERER